MLVLMSLLCGFFYSHVAEDHLVFWKQKHIEQMNPFSQTFL